MIMSRKPFIVWTAAEKKRAEDMANILCTQEEICAIMDIDTNTIARIIKDQYGLVFSEWYKKYSAFGKQSLRRSQFKMSQQNPTMAIWLGKQILDQSDKNAVSLTADISATTVAIDSQSLTAEERSAMIRILRKVAE